MRLYRPEAESAAKDFEIVNINDAPNWQGPYTDEQLADPETNIEGNWDASLALSCTWPTRFLAYNTGG
jgi:hypothetical protein